MTTATIQYDEFEADYRVDGREERNSTATFDRSPRAQYLTRARFRRQPSRGQNGIHRRGRKSF
jgi:hypothetical protein